MDGAPPKTPHRKRMKRRETDWNVRFLTFSCERRLPLLGDGVARDVIAGLLAAARTRFAFELFAWVAMPEHVHLLLRPGAEHPVERILYHVKRPFSLWAVAAWRRSCPARLHEITLRDGSLRVWQKGGGFDRNVRDTGEFIREFIYIHRNPVERGLAAAPADWARSSARWWLGMREGDAVPCDVMPSFEEEEFARMIRERAGGGAPDPRQQDGAG